MLQPLLRGVDSDERYSLDTTHVGRTLQLPDTSCSLLAVLPNEVSLAPSFTTDIQLLLRVPFTYDMKRVQYQEKTICTRIELAFILRLPAHRNFSGRQPKRERQDHNRRRTHDWQSPVVGDDVMQETLQNKMR